VSKLRIAPPPTAPAPTVFEQYPTAEAMRTRMEDGSLTLRGVVAILRRLEQEFDDDHEDVMRLLANVVDAEADAMGWAEAFLLQVA
jgi:hypothetical protein